jgi:hypothetical protein
MPEPTVWLREAHTEAKNGLLRASFAKWISVHSEFFAERGHGVVCVYDGFVEYLSGQSRQSTEAIVNVTRGQRRWCKGG